MPNQGDRQHRVAILYQFFAHYRGPVMRELISNGKHHYILFGEQHDPENLGRKPMPPVARDRFTRLPSRLVLRRFLVQRGAVSLAFRRDIDTIICLGNWQYITTWILAACARANGKRVLFWTIGWTRPDTGMLAPVRRMFYRLAHGLLLYGNNARRIAIDSGFDPQRLYVVYNSLDYEEQRRVRDSVTGERIRQIREELFPGTCLPMLICTTRLEPKRRLDVLYDAMVMLRDEGHEVSLLLVGAGSQREQLEGMARARNLKVKFYGPCYEEPVLGELIMSANATVAPGMVGLAAMHSLAYGTPVVTHRDPCLQAPESEAILDGQNGTLYEHGSLEDLVRAIKVWTGTVLPDPGARIRCYDIIDQYYNPAYQRSVVDAAVDGVPAVTVAERAASAPGPGPGSPV